jgi:hypothetical protein
MDARKQCEGKCCAKTSDNFDQKIASSYFTEFWELVTLILKLDGGSII